MSIPDNNFITIVSGLPRSGTSMMMRMLAAGGMPVLSDGIRQPDQDNPYGYFEYEPVKKVHEDASWIAGASGKAVKMVYALLYSLPAAHTYKVILMNRNLDEVIASQDAMLHGQGKNAEGLSPAETAAVFRVHIERLRSWLRGKANFAVVDVNYKDVVTAPAKAALDVSRFLDSGLNVDAMIGAVDTSLYRQRRS